jgi:hypothetical protein
MQVFSNKWLFHFSVLPVVVLIFISFLSNAQVVNIEQTRMVSDSNAWTGKMDATYQYQDFQEVLTNASLRLVTQFKSKKYFLLGLCEYSYSGNPQIDYANNLMMHLRYGIRLRKYTRWEFFHQGQRNPVIGIDWRFLHGVGPRFRIFADSVWRFHVGTVAMHETERPLSQAFETKGLQRQEWRSSTYINVQILKNPVEFSGTVYYQPLFQFLSDYRFSGQYSFTVKVSRRLSLNLEWTHYYDSKPPNPILNRFRTFTMGLGYVF